LPTPKVPTLRDAIVFVQSQEPAALEQLRNNLEIGIYHAEEHLVFLVKYTWFYCALSAFVAFLGKDVVALIVTLVVAGLAYTMKSLSSRNTAIGLIVVGILIGVDVPYRLLTPGQPHTLLAAFALGAVFLGADAAKTIGRLNKLRALRSLIPLPPARHLQEPDS
jgi:hypothetical protein